MHAKALLTSFLSFRLPCLKGQVFYFDLPFDRNKGIYSRVLYLDNLIPLDPSIRPNLPLQLIENRNYDIIHYIQVQKGGV